MEMMNTAKVEEMLNLNIVCSRVSKNCQCNELEERSKKAEVRCAELEIELQKEKDHCEALEAKVKLFEREKFALESELRVLKMVNEGLNRPEDVTGEKERAIEPIVDLEKHSDTVQSDIGRGNYYDEEKGKKKENKQIRGSADGSMRLDTSFDFLQNQEEVTEESPSKKTTLPANTKSTPVDVIDISDSDDEHTQDPVPDRQGSRNVFISPCFAVEEGKNSHSSSAQSNEEKLDFGEELFFAPLPNTKRKRACNVVKSESESDDDDNIPISKLKSIHMQEASADQVTHDLNSSSPAAISEDDEFTDNVKSRRRLQPLRKCLRKSNDDKMSSRRPHRAKHQQSIPTYIVDDDDADDDQSDNEGESMSSFIVNDDDSDSEDTFSQKSPRDDGSNSDMDSASSNLQDVSDGEMNLGEILSKIQRSKINRTKWEYQTDMLAAFGKDPELCMKAVCSIYKQQTAAEQMSKKTMCNNNRGFNKGDAPRGSALGEFLTDGDPDGGLKKSVEELEEYEPDGVEECRTLAIRYSKQLYEIYLNNEDPFFP